MAELNIGRGLLGGILGGVAGYGKGIAEDGFAKRERFYKFIEQGGKIESAGAKTLGEKDVAPLGRDIIHSVTNSIPRLTGAIHVYGGDFFGTTRSEWDPETLLERPYDLENAMRLFEEANAQYAAE